MKLTQTQIKELYKFTRAHYVAHYDLQTELVDHLANGIEKQWEEHPNLSFEEAKEKEFKKFGVFGFMDVVSDRQRAMGTRYREIMWRFFKEWLQTPKILLLLSTTVVLSFVLHQILNQETKQNVAFGLTLLLALGSFGYLYITRKNRQLNLVRGGKKWMLGEMIFGFGNIIQVSNLFLQIGLSIVHFEEMIVNNIWFDIVFSVLWVSLCLATYIAMIVIPSKAEELLAETYPEYKFQ